MRKLSIACRAAGVVLAVSLSATGQQAVHRPTSSNTGFANIAVDLPVEPVRDLPGPTLASTAARNDYPHFDELYRAAQNRGELPAAFAELHQFWTWSLGSPTGAFYGPDIHDQLAAKFPGYSAYIEDFRLVDERGSVFYPSAETRSFLLASAVEDVVPQERSAPVTADGAPAVPKPAVRVARSRHAAAYLPAPSVPTRKAVPAAAFTPQASPARAAAPSIQPQAIPQLNPVPPQPQDHRLSEALLLTILGLIGIGVVMLVLQAPGEEESGSSSHTA